MKNYRIAIPSFNRPEVIKNKTLALLESYNIPFENIDLFLENDEQYEKYYTSLNSDKYQSINPIITYTKGIGLKRNYIRWHYKENTDYTHIFCIDDDIDSICEKIDDKTIRPVEDLDSEIVNCFFSTEVRKLNIWGVNGCHNPFFLKDSVSTNLKYICGAFFGIIIDRKSNKKILQTSYDHYEDFDFSVQHFIRDGGVVRFNKLCIKTKYFGEGGINESYGGLIKRKNDMKIAGFRFISEYGNYARLIEKDYGFDIRLKHTAKSPKTQSKKLKN